jgi:predicted metalloprotease with PDZ domain
VAGIDVDDLIISVDGTSINTNGDFNTAIGNHKPGESIPITYNHRGQITDTSLLLKENPMLNIAPLKQQLNTSQQTFKDAWLGTKVKE